MVVARALEPRVNIGLIVADSRALVVGVHREVGYVGVLLLVSYGDELD